MPLADASVQVSRVLVVKGGTVPQIGKSATTDREGRFVISGARAGDILVNVSSDLHVGVTKSVHLADGEEMTLDFALPPTPSISGHVWDENEKPVEALVWLIDLRYRAGVLSHGSIGPQPTDKNGSFRFESDLEAGRSYYVLAERSLTRSRAERDPGHLEKRTEVEESTYYGDASSLSAARPVIPGEGEHRGQVDIKIHKTIPYCVDGSVSLSGEPTGLALTIREAALAGLRLTPFQFESVEDGTFHLCGITRGEYTIAPLQIKLGGFRLLTVTDSDLHDVVVNVDTADLYLDLSWDGEPPAEQHATVLPPRGVTVHVTHTADGVPQIERSEIRSGPAIAEGSEIAVILTGGGSAEQSSKAAPAPYRGPFGADLLPGDYAVEARVASGSYVKELLYNGVPVADRMIQLAAGIHGTLQVVATKGGGAVTVKVADGDEKLSLARWL